MHLLMMIVGIVKCIIFQYDKNADLISFFYIQVAQLNRDCLLNIHLKKQSRFNLVTRYFCTIWVSKRRKRVINVQIYCVALQMSLSGLEFTHELDLIQVFYYYCGQETYLSPLLYRVSLVYNTQWRKIISHSCIFHIFIICFRFLDSFVRLNPSFSHLS